MKLLFILFQYLVPKKTLSRLAGRLADSQTRWLKQLLIGRFIDYFDVDMSEAENPDPADYPSFNAFFTRPLEQDARPVAQENAAIACPADGAISQLGTIDDGRLIQAKGLDYGTVELLGGDEQLAQAFHKGQFATIYLSPTDYHRVHMPLDGTLKQMIYIPGSLFSVNRTTTGSIHNLFTRNERVVCLFDTAAGPMAVILVGAIICGSIETVWAGSPTSGIQTTHYEESQAVISLSKGEELGRFKLGSTVIVLFGDNQTSWIDELTENSIVRMGEKIGQLAVEEMDKKVEQLSD